MATHTPKSKMTPNSDGSSPRGRGNRVSPPALGGRAGIIPRVWARRGGRPGRLVFQVSVPRVGGPISPRGFVLGRLLSRFTLLRRLRLRLLSPFYTWPMNYYDDDPDFRMIAHIDLGQRLDKWGDLAAELRFVCRDRELVQELDEGQYGYLHRLTEGDRYRVSGLVGADVAASLDGKAAAVMWVKAGGDDWEQSETNVHLLTADEVSRIERTSFSMLLANVVREHSLPASSPSPSSPAVAALVAHARDRSELSSEFPYRGPSGPPAGPPGERLDRHGALAAELRLVCQDHEIVQELGTVKHGRLHRLTEADRERLAAVDGAEALDGKAAALVWSKEAGDLWDADGLGTNVHVLTPAEVAAVERTSLTMLLTQVVREHQPPASSAYPSSPALDALVVHVRAHCDLGSEFPEPTPVERLRAPIPASRPAETDEPAREGFVKLRDAGGTWSGEGADGRRYEARPVEHRDGGEEWETWEVDVHDPRPIVGEPGSRVTEHDGRSMRTLYEAERFVNVYERAAASYARMREDHMRSYAPVPEGERKPVGPHGDPAVASPQRPVQSGASEAASRTRAAAPELPVR